MQYSLLSRVQGCLLGMILGEQAGRSQETTWLTPSSSPEPTDPDVGASRWNQVAIELLQAMTRSHQWHSTELVIQRLQDRPASERYAGTIAIATLPLALYFHDDLNRQRHALVQVCEALSVDAVSQTWVRVFAYMIAQAVKGQLAPDTIIAQSLAYMRVSTPTEVPSPDSVLDTLQQLDTAQAENAPLTSWVTDRELGPEMAIALMCFLQTPEDMRLALTRATRLGTVAPRSEATPAIPSLVGALVGTQASVAGIPPSFQGSLSWSPAADHSRSTVLAWAESLVTSWAGVYDPTAIAASPAVAAPWVIRS